MNMEGILLMMIEDCEDILGDFYEACLGIGWIKGV